jgi:hypothetical protein
MTKIEPVTVSGISFCAGGLLYDAGALQKACYITCPHNSQENSKRKNCVPVFSQSSVLSSKRGSSKGKLLSEGDCVFWWSLCGFIVLLLSLVSGILVAVARNEKTRVGKIFALSATGSQPNKKLRPEREYIAGSPWSGGAREPRPPPARPIILLRAGGAVRRHSPARPGGRSSANRSDCFHKVAPPSRATRQKRLRRKAAWPRVESPPSCRQTYPQRLKSQHHRIITPPKGEI